MSGRDVKINKPEGVRIAALVPAYNEERGIRNVIHSLRVIPELDEIIVVSDGSEDRTAEIVLEEYGVKLVDLKENVGKGGALRAGVRATDADIIMLIDADLIGLTREHVALLLNPVLEGRENATIGIFREGRVMTDLAQIVAPQLSGQRAMLRELLATAPIDDTRYGVEVALNRHLEENGVTSFEVELHNVTQHLKEEKFGVMRGFAVRVKMYYEVFKTALTGKKS